MLIHAAHGATGGSFGFFFRDFTDESAHSNRGCSDTDGVLDSFAGNAGGVDDAVFLEVDETFVGGHDVNSLAGFGFFDFGEEGGSVQAGVF